MKLNNIIEEQPERAAFLLTKEGFMHSWVAYRFMILINQLNADLEQVHGISEEDRSSIQGVIDELSRVVLETFK